MVTERRWEEEREVSKVLARERQGSGNFPPTSSFNDGVCNCIDPINCGLAGFRMARHGMSKAVIEAFERLEKEAGKPNIWTGEPRKQYEFIHFFKGQ